MEEIANQFKEELQELLDRYKDKMSTPQIMRIAQPIFTKTIGIRDNPERFIAHPSLTNKWSQEDLKGEWKSVKEAEALIYKGHCTSQEIAEADCDGDIRHCKDVCHKIQAKGVKL